MKGRVVSKKMLKTAVVLVTDIKTHPLYQKTYVRSKRFLVDDKLGTKPGDIVELKQIRPLSKRKSWQILKVIGRDIEEIVEEELKQQAQEVIEEVMPVEEKVAEQEKEEKSDDKKESKGKNQILKNKNQRKV